MKKNVILFLFVAGYAYAAHQNGRDFQVTLQNCAEYVGTGSIVLSRVNSFVPARFTVANDGAGNATIVGLSAKCGAVTVSGFNAGPATVTQVGINIVSPDGTGDINNYTVAYATDSEKLALR